MTADWFDAVPKAELHLHVQGAIPLDALWELIRKYGDASVPDPSALPERFAYRDFSHFIQTWVWVRGFMREYDDIRFTTEAFARQLVAQNILYVEAFFSPSDYHKQGLETQKIAEAKGELFRTMCKDAERLKSTLCRANASDGPQFHMRDDPRLLRVGR